MAPYYHEVPYDAFMASYVNVSAYDNSQATLSDAQLASISERVGGLGNTFNAMNTNTVLCAALQAAADTAQAIHPNAQKYVFKDTSCWPETFHDNVTPTLAMYPDTEAAKEGYMRDVTTEPGDLYTAGAAWAWITMPIDVTNNHFHAAFNFSEGGLLRESPKGEEARERLVEYARRMMLRQHRTFTFMLCICRNKARITRWDRAGCIASEPFEFGEDPRKLLDIVSHLVLMAPAELGYDPTAVLATEEEVEALLRIDCVNRHAREYADEILDPEVRLLYPIYKITCANVGKEGYRVYFVGKHSSESSTFFGRATKGYAAFVQKSSRLCFLKDYWRPSSEKVPHELDIYKTLTDAGVRHIATVIGGGDVDGGSQQTEMVKYVQDPQLEALRRLRRVHCRVVLKELARPLTRYSHSGQLINAVYHALTAHKDAWEKAGILHRDISANNIMCVIDQRREPSDNVRGILIDWDLCRRRSELDEGAENNHCGTWEFMSATMLRYPLKPNELADDLESFIYVISHCCLRFHVHTLTDIRTDLPPVKINARNAPLREYVDVYYHSKAPTHNNLMRGGKYKLICARLGHPQWELSHANVSTALENLVPRLYALLMEHYAELDFQALKKYSGKVLDDVKPPVIEEQMEVDPLEGTINPSEAIGGDYSDALASLFAPPVEPRNLVLDSHSAILAAFEEAIDELNSGAARRDKTKDQFLGLYKRHTTGLESGSGSSSSTGHRRPSTDGSSDYGRPFKKMRLTESTGHSVPMDT